MPDDALRERLVAGAANLFYRGGITATGTATLSRELGISKRTMYECYSSKDDLVAAALRSVDAPIRAMFTDVAVSDDPRLRLIEFFTGVDDFVHQPDFRGCPFLNAAAELTGRDHPALVVCRDHKRALRAWLQRTARDADVTAARALGEQLMLLLDGALAQAAVRPPARGRIVQAATALVDSAIRDSAPRRR